jgi:tRNA (guanine-N7-)-methyltransferase
MPEPEPLLPKSRPAPKTAREYQDAAPRAPEQGYDLLELFPQCAEIEMEIGFGRGQFLLQRRAAAPEVGLLGIEIKSKWAYLVAERVARLSLPRLCAVADDARVLLPKLRPSGVLSRVFMSFPDPWWKKRHEKRRLMDAELLEQEFRLSK